MIYFDLDGVIRYLSAQARGGKEPATWNEPVPNGDSLCDHIDKNPDLLLTAEKTKYFDVIKSFSPISIITHQQPGWKVNTMKWIDYNLPDAEVIFVTKSERKMDFIRRSDFIVEDSPNFPEPFYNNVILIDWKYNQAVKEPFSRIMEPTQLERLLRRMM
jgi:hypothetical protein